MTKTGPPLLKNRCGEVGAPLQVRSVVTCFCRKSIYGFTTLFGNRKIPRNSFPRKNAFSISQQLCPLAFVRLSSNPVALMTKNSPLDQITKNLASQFECITIDGVRVVLMKIWGAVRCSNTSPNPTIRFEALMQKRLKEIMALMLLELKISPK